MAHPVADMFRQAATLNRRDPLRQGNVLIFRADQRLIVSGDVHGDRANLSRILAHAKLGTDPARVLVLQEIIHGGPTDSTGGDRSIELLMRAGRLKIQHPTQVAFLMGNHDIAQLTRNEITKEGCGVCAAFDLGLRNAFGEAAPEVAQAVNEFFASLPLAGRTEGGVFLCHSLPSPGRQQYFDPRVLDRPLQEEDFKRGGSVYELLWGRHHDEPLLHELATLLGVSFFVTGHQPQEPGFLLNPPCQLIIDSSHPGGAILELDGGERLEADNAPAHVRPIRNL